MWMECKSKEKQTVLLKLTQALCVYIQNYFFHYKPCTTFSSDYACKGWSFRQTTWHDMLSVSFFWPACWWAGLPSVVCSAAIFTFSCMCILSPKACSLSFRFLLSRRPKHYKVKNAPSQTFYVLFKMSVLKKKKHSVNQRPLKESLQPPY